MPALPPPGRRLRSGPVWWGPSGAPRGGRGGDAAGASLPIGRAHISRMAKEEERRQGWGPWVGILLALGVGLYFYVTCASHSKQHEAEYQRVIHAYEEAIFHKKVEVYKQEFKQK